MSRFGQHGAGISLYDVCLVPDSHEIVPESRVSVQFVRLIKVLYIKLEKLEQRTLVTCRVNVISAFRGFYYPPLVNSRKLFTRNFVVLRRL